MPQSSGIPTPSKHPHVLKHISPTFRPL